MTTAKEREINKNNKQTTPTNNALEVKKEKEKTVADFVLKKVKAFRDTGELKFPANYIPENALKASWLIIQETKDRNDKLALSVCTTESIANSLLSIVIQGLNPNKKQCYFIVYGNKLQLVPSYFGSMHIAKTLDGTIEDIAAEVVYEGDDLEYEIERGRKIITKHKQNLSNVDRKNIIAAYVCIIRKNEKVEYTIMTMDEIKEAWKQSKAKPFDEKGNLKVGSTHERFTAEMAMKTVINKACKPIINSSSDANIVAQYAKEMLVDITKLETEEEMNDNANIEFIDIEEADIEQGEGFNQLSESEKREIINEETGEIEAASDEKTGPNF